MNSQAEVNFDASDAEVASGRAQLFDRTWGDATDGDLTAGGTWTLTTQSSNGRSQPDGYTTNLVVNTGAGSTTLRVLAAAGFAADDEVLLISSKGSTAGRYEIRRIARVSGTTLTLESPLQNAYNHGSGIDITQVIRVPQYNTVNVTGRITARAWNGSTGGVVVFRARSLTNTGNIDVNSVGFRFGRANGCSAGYGFRGESYNGGLTQGFGAIGQGGSGGGWEYCHSGNGGGGGGHVSTGGSGQVHNDDAAGRATRVQHPLPVELQLEPRLCQHCSSAAAAAAADTMATIPTAMATAETAAAL
jgi:hypothetical protein